MPLICMEKVTPFVFQTTIILHASTTLFRNRHLGGAGVWPIKCIMFIPGTNRIQRTSGNRGCRILPPTFGAQF